VLPQTSDPSDCQTLVTIEIAGHRLRIHPVPSCLNCLVTRRVHSDGTALEASTESLLFDDCPFANAGLLEVVIQLLDRSRIDYEVVADGPTIPPLPPPNAGAMTPYGSLDAALLEIAECRHRRLIRFGEGCSKTLFIEQIARAFPEATLAIATSRTFDRDQFAKSLRKRQLEPVKVSTSVAPGNNPRIVVTTWYGLGHLELESWQRTFLLVPNALDAISRRAQDVLLQPGARFRLLGFLPWETILSPRERDLLTCIFGPRELVIPRHGHIPRPVGVIWRPFRHFPSDVPTTSILDCKRTRFWTNAARNRLICRVARAFSRPQLDENRGTRPNDLCATQRHVRPVTVLTESAEHAIELGALLPEFSICLAPRSDGEGLSRGQRQILDRAARLASNPSHPHTIATLGGLSEARLWFTEILLWAGAGPTAPELAAGGVLTTLTTVRPLLLVDISDSGTDWLRHWTDRRRADYERNSWFAPGEDSAMCAIERFLASRPEVVQ
jgi:hypothetical protein